MYLWSAVTGTEKTILREKNISDIYRGKKLFRNWNSIITKISEINHTLRL